MFRTVFITGILLTALATGTVFADCRGCCSRHGGVVCVDGDTKCKNGTSLSGKCSAKGCDKCGGEKKEKTDD